MGKKECRVYYESRVELIKADRGIIEDKIWECADSSSCISGRTRDKVKKRQKTVVVYI